MHGCDVMGLKPYPWEVRRAYFIPSTSELSRHPQEEYQPTTVICWQTRGLQCRPTLCQAPAELETEKDVETISGWSGDVVEFFSECCSLFTPVGWLYGVILSNMLIYVGDYHNPLDYGQSILNQPVQRDYISGFERWVPFACLKYQRVSTNIPWLSHSHSINILLIYPLVN